VNTENDLSNSDQLSINSEMIEIVPYQSSWAETFQYEHDSLQSVLNDTKIGSKNSIHIEHIGSTAVAGLCAKPIVDLMVGIDEWQEDFSVENTLQDLGYVIANPPQQLLPNTHFLFRRGNQEHRTHHLHVVEHKSEFWSTRLLYRDYLRENDSISTLYGTLKTIGAEQHRYDRIAYNDFKAPFIRACLRAASGQNSELF